MKQSIRGTTKKRGRPKTTGKGLSINVRLHKDLLTALDRWVKAQRDPPSRPEAIRYALKDWLVAQGIIPFTRDREDRH